MCAHGGDSLEASATEPTHLNSVPLVLADCKN